jgi:hypothetical protein
MKIWPKWVYSFGEMVAGGRDWLVVQPLWPLWLLTWLSVVAVCMLNGIVW